MKKAAYHHGDLRRALLNAALAEVGRSGRADFTLRSLAQGLGVSHAAAYRHFRSREALLAELAAEAFSRFSDALEKGARSPGPFAEHYARQGRAYIDFALDHPGYYLLMFRAPSPGAEASPQLEREGQRAWEGLLAMVRAGQAAGRIRAGDPQALALIIWSGIHGLVSLILDGRAAPGQPAGREWAYAQAALQGEVLLKGMAPAAKPAQRAFKAPEPERKAAAPRKKGKPH